MSNTDVTRFHDHFDLDTIFNERYDDVLSELLEHCPVARSDEGYAVVTRFADVRRCANDFALFSSAAGGVLAERPEGLAPQYPVESDPPLHTQLRQPLNPFFSPAEVAQYEGGIRRVASSLVDDFVADGRCDAVRHFAAPFPGSVLFSEFLKLPGDLVATMNEGVFETFMGPLGGRRDGAQKLGEGVAACLEVAAQRDGDDLLGAVAGLRVDGQPAPFEIKAGVLSSLIIGGLETTSNVLAQGLWWLAAHPAERDRLITDPELVPQAVEEFCRVFTSAWSLGRTAMQDTTVAGREVRAGEFLLLAWAAACRDPEVFPNPLRVDFDREYTGHLAFGAGRHRCVGSNLARLELRVAVEVFLARVPNFRLQDGAEQRFHTTMIRAIDEVPLVFDPPMAGAGR